MAIGPQILKPSASQKITKLLEVKDCHTELTSRSSIWKLPWHMTPAGVGILQSMAIHCVCIAFIDYIHTYVLKEVGWLFWKCCLVYSLGVEDSCLCIREGTWAWSGLIWLRLGTIGGLLWIWQWNFGFRKMRGVSCLAEKLLACQEGLYSLLLFCFGGKCYCVMWGSGGGVSAISAFWIINSQNFFILPTASHYVIKKSDPL